jgi:hypothetical protein
MIAKESPSTLIMLRFLGSSEAYPIFANAASALGSTAEPRLWIGPLLMLTVVVSMDPDGRTVDRPLGRRAEAKKHARSLTI